MKSRSWVSLSLLTFAAGCGVKDDQTVAPSSNHGEVLQEPAKGKFPWGPAAPEPPLMASPTPPFPEQPKSPLNPGDGSGPKAEDGLIPKTEAGSMPR